MIIFQKGRGWLIPVSWGLGIAIGAGVTFANGSYQEAGWWPVTALFGTITLAIVSKFWLQNVEMRMVDPDTGRPYLLRERHSFYFLPAHTWVIISVLLIGYAYKLGLEAQNRFDALPAPLRHAARKLIDELEGRLDQSAPSGGNTALTSALAKRLAAAIHDKVATQNPDLLYSELRNGGIQVWAAAYPRHWVVMVGLPARRRLKNEELDALQQQILELAKAEAEQLEAGPELLTIYFKHRSLVRVFAMSPKGQQLASEAMGENSAERRFDRIIADITRLSAGLPHPQGQH
jgi:hypothetical protein